MASREQPLRAALLDLIPAIALPGRGQEPTVGFRRLHAKLGRSTTQSLSRALAKMEADGLVRLRIGDSPRDMKVVWLCAS